MATGVVLSWLCFSRPLMLNLIFLGRPAEIKPIHFPLLLVSQWSGSLVKIWTQMNLAQQKWSNRGNQSISATGAGFERLAKRSTARFLLVTQLFCFGVFLGWFSGALNPSWDLQGWLLSHQASTQLVQQINAIDHGIQPSDGQDDAAALNALLASLPAQPEVVVNLPLGELDLFSPLEIGRSNLTIRGEGAGRTVLRGHFGSEAGEAMIKVRPQVAQLIANPVSQEQSEPSETADKLQNVRLSGFTLRLVEADETIARESPVDGILIEKLETGAITHLAIEAGTRQPLVMSQSGDIRLEYVADGTSAPFANNRPPLEAEARSENRPTAL